jgi:hypothetical protein
LLSVRLDGPVGEAAAWFLLAHYLTLTKNLHAIGYLRHALVKQTLPS